MAAERWLTMRKDLFVDPSFGLMTAVEHVNLKLVTGIYSAQYISKFPRVKVLSKSVDLPSTPPVTGSTYSRVRSGFLLSGIIVVFEYVLLRPT